MLSILDLLRIITHVLCIWVLICGCISLQLLLSWFSTLLSTAARACQREPKELNKSPQLLQLINSFGHGMVLPTAGLMKISNITTIRQLNSWIMTMKTATATHENCGQIAITDSTISLSPWFYLEWLVWCASAITATALGASCAAWPWLELLEMEGQVMGHTLILMLIHISWE